MADESKPLAEGVALQIAQKIQHGDYRAGQAIPSERAIAEQFGVSRPTAHQAVQILARQGHIETNGGRRPLVVIPKADQNEGFSPAAIAGMLRKEDGRASLEQLRQIMEVGAVRTIARGGALNHIGRLMTQIQLGEQASSAEGFIAADANFHRALISCLENRIVLGLYDSFISELFARRLNLALDQDRWPRVLGQHRAIVEAIRKRDHVEAASILEDHLMDAYTSSLTMRE